MKTRSYLDSDYGGGQGEDNHHGEDHVETVQHLLGDVHSSDQCGPLDIEIISEEFIVMLR